MESLVGQTLLGRYRLQRFIGRGGMAVVYEAWDSRRSAAVAIKLMHEDLAEDTVFLRRFAREADTLARLNHPSIVRFFGFEEARDLAFLVMEYIKGVSLSRQLRRLGRPLTLPETTGILQPVCSALHYAHQLGVYHCDIKPANIFIDESGRVMLGDFGISRLSESATVTFSTPGSPAYMSPEQCHGGSQLDGRTDIYSLGISTYEMLTLDRPFKGETAQTTGSITERVRWEQINISPPSPRQANAAIPSDIERGILRTLEKDPGRRFQEVMGFLTVMQRGSSVQPAVMLPAAGVIEEAASGPRTAPADSHAHPSQAAPREQAGRIVIIVGMSLIAIIILAFGFLIIRSRTSPTAAQPPGQESSAAVGAVMSPTAQLFEQPINPTPVAVVVETADEESQIAPVATAQPVADPPTLTPMPPTLTPSNVYLLYALNASNDMMDNGELAIAQQGLADHLEKLDPTINAGLLAFGHQLTLSDNNACSDANVELRQPMGTGNAQAIWDSITLLNPKGIAPFADALVQAHNYFGFSSGQTNALVLITDGENDCDADADVLRRVVNRQQEVNQTLPLYIFGIDLDEKQVALFQALVTYDGMVGKFTNVTSAAELTTKLDDLMVALSG